MINIYLVLGVLLTHFVADFLLQTDWMAKNKSTNNKALLSHVLVYTATFLVFALVLHGFAILTLPVAIIWVLFNGLMHFITDYFTSRLNTYLWNKKEVHYFFVSIGADQFIHYCFLLLTLVRVLH